MRLIHNILLQHHLHNHNLTSTAHLLLFSKFIVLLIKTILITIKHLLTNLLNQPPSYPIFHYKLYYIIYKTILNNFNIALIIGYCFFLQQHFHHPTNLNHNNTNLIILFYLLFLNISNYIIKKLQILQTQTIQPKYSFIKLTIAQLLETNNIDHKQTITLHHWNW